MLEELKNKIYSSEPFQLLLNRAKGLSPASSIVLTGISGSLMAFLAAIIYSEYDRQVVVIVPDKDKAEQLRDDCAVLLPELQVQLFAAGPAHRSVQLDVSLPIAQVEALRTLSNNEQTMIIVSAEALSVKLPSPKIFLSRSITLAVNKEYSFTDLLQQLQSLGFEKKDFVEEYGDYAVRGGILDIFPFVGEHPLRVEFWGDAVESIREFDVLSQRSIRELQGASIVADIRPRYEHGEFFEEQENIEPLLHPSSTFFDYLQSQAMILCDEPILCRKEFEELSAEDFPDLLKWEEIEARMHSFSTIIHSQLHIDQPHCIQFSSQSQPSVAGSIKRLIDQIKQFNRLQMNVYIACDSKEESVRLAELIEEELTSPSPSLANGPAGDTGAAEQDGGIRFQFVLDGFHSGFVFPASKGVLLTEHEIFGRLKRRGSAKRRKFKGISQKELQQLRRGDFVVHQDYGIGKFAGLQKIKVRGVETEVMKLMYDGSDLLYVNLSFVNRVQKYSSQEGHTPKLSKLGGPDWDRLKSRARKKIKDIARDLIKLYARRKSEQGFVCAPDTHWQKEMEASFMYEDTPDQAKAAADVKDDMEQLSPMDRLICGDVGFGKTEVAVRAAFKAVMNGKQIAVLVPTTILAQQHYQTFSDRVGRYSVRVECINRFKTKKEQSAILEALKAGQVDIIIGTHRLLSKDVAFKDLGLLIIDEEQRFGVSAKEKLRHLRASVDTLTLTATPIPRTLQFSLMGARDLSLITTAPRNRLPIQTEIAQFDEKIIHEAIMKELHRGGQVYVVHDRIQNIDLIQAMLEKHVPKAKFHVAHGQMKGHELERTMLDFLEKKFDVLICTKIIESGIDIPSVNTIIINRADRFGMAELYQLRGRVGRSNVQAYAYLLTPPLSVLPRQTLRRLQAIQEFTELGSGFNLAMRDLEIRGAGNLLGGEQSGFILEMGFEMYQKVVEEAVRELKEEEFKELVAEKPSETAAQKTETIIETDIEALIPEIYVESAAERLDIYRRLYRCERADDVLLLKQELRDRFGEYPEEVEHLLQSVELKILGAALQLSKIEIIGSVAKLFFPPAETVSFYEGEQAPFQRIARHIQTPASFISRLKQDGKQLYVEIQLKNPAQAQQRLRGIGDILASLAA